jgi:hypothetical protein
LVLIEDDEGGECEVFRGGEVGSERGGGAGLVVVVDVGGEDADEGGVGGEVGTPGKVKN